MSIRTELEPSYTISDLGFDKSLVKLDPKASILDGITPELRNIFTEGIAPKTILSGELLAVLDQLLANLHSGKTEFTITQSGYILGVDPTDQLAKFYLGNATNYMFFDGTNLQITGGTVLGDVGGFVVTATALTGGALVLSSAGNSISWGTGNNIMIADADDATYRLWIGHATAASAPFRVTKAGVVVADIDGGSIDGTIIGAASAAAATFTTVSGTAITGTSFVIGANTLTTSEWAFLDGQNQAVATGSSPTFVNLTVTSIIIGANTLTTSEWAFLDGQNQAVLSTSSPTFVNLTITSFAANWTNAGRTVADLGIITTADINGGTLDAVAIGSTSPSSGIFTSLRADTITNDTGLAAGVYTPADTAHVNIDGSDVTMLEAQYMRVGNTVTVSGRFTADPTLTATATSFEIDLPVASNIGALEDLAGVAFCGAIAAQGAQISGSIANNTAVFTWVSGDITSQSWSFTFTYQVI